ncbi:MAG: NF038122 family metalloprotease [Kovacikia sp.]
MVTFNLGFAPGTTLQQMVGFETAAKVWSSYLTDNLTLNLYVGVSSSLPSNVIGGALPGISASQSYNSIKSALIADAKSTDDQTATKTLPSNQITARFDLISANGSNNQVEAQSKTLNLTTANAKAMGRALPNGGTGLDGVIVFGSLSGSAYSWNYDYTRSTAAPANSLDFLSTAMHEIGHVLGFVSGVDKPGWLDSTVLNATQQSLYKAQLTTQILYTTPLDLFRDSALTLNKDRLDLSYGSNGGAKYFSIDGKTAIAQFSTGNDTSLGGNGEQASHWLSGTNGIMAPTLAPNQRLSISSLDLQAMDVIGWDLAPNAANLKLDLSALAGQSQQVLANRLGQTVTWLNANAVTAAASLSQDRSQDILTMVQNSQIYNWGTTTLNPFRQVIDMMSRQVVYGSFETLEELPGKSLAAPPTPASVAAASLAGVDAKGNHNPLLVPSQPVDRSIRAIVQAMNRYQSDADSFSHPDLPRATATTAKFVTFSGTQLPGIESKAAPLQGSQSPLGQAQRYFLGASARRPEASAPRSHASKSFEQDFDLLTSPKPG